MKKVTIIESEDGRVDGVIGFDGTLMSEALGI